MEPSRFQRIRQDHRLQEELASLAIGGIVGWRKIRRVLRMVWNVVGCARRDRIDARIAKIMNMKCVQTRPASPERRQTGDDSGDQSLTGRKDHRDGDLDPFPKSW